MRGERSPQHTKTNPSQSPNPNSQPYRNLLVLCKAQIQNASRYRLIALCLETLARGTPCIDVERAKFRKIGLDVAFVAKLA